VTGRCAYPDCQLFAGRSAIIKGVYYARICDTHFTQLTSGQTPSSGHASYNRQRDLEDHLADVAQPFVGGKPNPDFIKLYPEQAARHFTPDEMRKYG
jgi:hypothetical protein